MVLVYDSVNKKVVTCMGTNSMFPDGNIPNLPTLPEGHVYIKFNDDSAESKSIMTAQEYELTFYKNGNLKEVIVTKTVKQAAEEQKRTTVYKRQQILNELKELDVEIPRIVEDIIKQGAFEIHPSKQALLERKQALRTLLITLQ